MEYTLNSGAGSASSRQQLRARCHTAPSPVRVWREPPGAAGRALAASRHTAVPKACKSTQFGMLPVLLFDGRARTGYSNGLR